jgi:glyoxylase-like metal-dependent hydrolase (beta-lactamase superfamily II)
VSRPPAIALADGVYRIPTMGDFINSFAFVDADGSVTLVDCGLKRAPKKIVAGLAAIGKHPHDVQRILLTHAHFDHAGGAARMVEETSADGVDVHADDAGYVRTGTKPPGDTASTAGRLLARAPWGDFRATPVAQELIDGQVLDVAGGVRVLHTPGHTPGHISLLHPGSGVLITGDSIFNMNSRMSWPTKAFCTSFRQNVDTAHVLGEIEYAVAAFTHGPEIRDDAREQVRGFLRRASRKSA